MGAALQFMAEHIAFVVLVVGCLVAVLGQYVWLRKTTEPIPWVFWVIAALLLIPTWFLTQEAARREKSHIQDVVTGFARLYASEMETLGHWKLPMAAGSDDPLYLELIRTEKRWLTVNPSVHDIYTLRKLPDGRNAFVVDSETDYDHNQKYEGEREERTDIGEIYDVKDPGLERAFLNELNFDIEPITDRWGTWVSGYAPIHDPDGKNDGVLGVDFDANEFYRLIGAARMRMVAIMALVQAVLFGSSTLICLLRGKVSERIRAEAALRRSEQRLRSVSQCAHDAIISVDGLDRIVGWNHGAAVMFGYSEEEAIGQPMVILIPERHRQVDTSGIQFFVPNDQPHVPGKMVELDGLRQDGTEFPLELSLSTWLADEQTFFTHIIRDITERKEAEVVLKKTQSQLLEASRNAGMAEVATSVLHNVGNVLNSVNVSVAMARDKVRRMKIESISKAATLLQQHPEDLAQFLTRDPAGAQLPAFLGRVAESLTEKQNAVLKELESLNANIGHIKEIVAMQQGYARVAGIVEVLPLTELVEDAIRLNAGALEQYGVRIVREFEQLPPFPVEKHKVLQVLVNLVRNAKHALDDSGRQDKQLTLRVGCQGKSVKISVADNGIGITQENLTRIFEHGFTTRLEGHGFGLHSGALAATEMGGSLVAQSDGPSKGAIFTLHLPLHPATSLS